MFKAMQLLWPFVRPYRFRLLLALLFGVVMALLAVLLPIFMQLLLIGLNQSTIFAEPSINKYLDFFSITPESAPWLLVEPKTLVMSIAVALPIYYLFSGLVRFLHFYWVKYLGEAIISDIRTALMDKFMEMDVLYLSRQEKGAGSLMSRTLNDTMVLQLGLQYFADLLREPILGVVMVIYMFMVNWKMTLGCFLFLPIFAGVIRYVAKSLKKFGHQSQESLEEVTHTLKEGMDGVRVIQSFNLQARMKSRFHNQVADFLNKRRKIIKREVIGGPINEVFAAILVAGIIIFQAEQIWAGESSASAFIAFLLAGGLLQAPIKKTQQAIIYVQQSIVAIERLNEVLVAKSSVTEPSSPQAFPGQWNEIAIDDVSFAYGDTKVLENVNLKIKKGEVIALVGESGSGKSTLAGLLQRYFDPQSGKIRIGETSLNAMTTQDLRKNIGYVTQDVFLFDDTVENNIWYGDLERSKTDVPAAAEVANATGFIANSPDGFQTIVGERGGRFSGGEKQRISIARAVFKDPPILILDEATSALDSASENEVQKGIERLLEGRTAIVIAHRLSTIMNSDRIIVMKDGKIVEEGDHTSLIAKNNEYARFYNLQFGDSRLN